MKDSLCCTQQRGAIGIVCVVGCQVSADAEVGPVLEHPFRLLNFPFRYGIFKENLVQILVQDKTDSSGIP